MQTVIRHQSSEENANKAKEMAEKAPRPEFVKLGVVQVMPVVESL